MKLDEDDENDEGPSIWLGMTPSSTTLITDRRSTFDYKPNDPLWNALEKNPWLVSSGAAARRGPIVGSYSRTDHNGTAASLGLPPRNTLLCLTTKSSNIDYRPTVT